MTFYRYRPIERWPVAKTPGHDRRSRWTFKAKWSDTLRLLENELAFLDADMVVLQVAVDESHLRQDGGLRANANPRWPGVILSFQSKLGPLSYPCDSCVEWQHNVRSIALALQALRAVDRYGVTKRAEQYQGWKQLPGTSIGMTVEVAHAVMDAFGNDLDRAKMETHPDHGGSVASFQQVMEAAEILGLK